MITRTLWLLTFACATLVSLGCSDEMYAQEGVRGPANDAGLDAPTQDASGDAQHPDAVRTLEVRNPYGNVQAVDNLLIDGDFEFSDHQGQYGWLSFSSYGLQLETGGLCRSGSTCGRLTRNRRMLAYAVAAQNQPMALSLWVKPKNGDCAAVAVYAIGCISDDTPVFAEAKSAADQPGADGWCELTARMATVDEQPCLYLENASDDDVLIDDAVLETAPEARVLPPSARAQSPLPPKVPVARYSRIRKTAEQARRRRRF
ncbi:MAG: hypothetical protein KC766_02930 [Myxococcales bacterium]|nr:hypothetical protein [Myxococcales bacterium]